MDLHNKVFWFSIKQVIHIKMKNEAKVIMAWVILNYKQILIVFYLIYYCPSYITFWHVTVFLIYFSFPTID